MCLLAGLFLLSAPAYAVCDDPPGSAGDMTYNAAFNVLQYCDGTNWIGIDSTEGGGSSGSSCDTTPVVITTPGMSSFVVPDGCDSLTIEAWGAGGGGGYGNATGSSRRSGGGGGGSGVARSGTVLAAAGGGAGGGGGTTTGASFNNGGGGGAYAILSNTAATAGESLTVYVGGGGQSSCSGGANGAGGGYNGTAGASGVSAADVADPFFGGGGGNGGSGDGGDSYYGGGGGDVQTGIAGQGFWGGDGGDQAPGQGAPGGVGDSYVAGSNGTGSAGGAGASGGGLGAGNGAAGGNCSNYGGDGRVRITPAGSGGAYVPTPARFDGGDWLKRGAGLTGAADSPRVTGSFWIKFNATTDWQRILSPAVGAEHFTIGRDNNDGLVLSVRNSGGGSLMIAGSDEATDGNWHHILFSVDLSIPVLHLYVDGQPGGWVAYLTTGIGDFTHTNWGIGAEPTNNWNPLEGDLADFWVDFGTYINLSVPANRQKFYHNGPVYLGSDGSLPLGTAPDIFLSGDLATWHTNKGAGGGFTLTGTLTSVTPPVATVTTQPDVDLITNLVGHWRLDDTSGNATDSSGGGRNGTLAGDAAWRPGGGWVAGAIELDGTGDYIEIPMGGSLNLTGSEGTISAWFKADNTSGTHRIASIPGNITTGLEKFALLVDNNRLELWARTGGNDHSTGVPFTDTSSWHHAAGVYDGTWVKLYLDGVYVASAWGGGNFPSNTDAMRIGSFSNAFPQYLNGMIDDVRVYSRALNELEIRALGCGGPASDCFQGARICSPGTITTGDLAQAQVYTSANINDPRQIAIVGDYAFVANEWTDNIVALNISNPISISEVDVYVSANTNEVFAIVADGDYAYALSGWINGVVALNISDPANITEVDSWNSGVDYSDLALSGNYLYLTSEMGDRLTILDVSNPADIQPRGSISNANLDGAYGIEVAEQYAYVAASIAQKLTVIDISNPDSPVVVGGLADPALNGAVKVKIAGSIAYVASYAAGSLTSIDISDPLNPRMLDTISHPEMFGLSGLSISSSYAYVVSETESSLTAIDISDPRNLTIADQFIDSDLAEAWNGNIYNGYILVPVAGPNAITVIQTNCTLTSGCTSPDAFPGTLAYNKAEHVMQYCNGAEWMGMALPGDGGGGCNNPSGVEGDIVYNTSHNVLQYCEGDQWMGVGK